MEAVVAVVVEDRAPRRADAPRIVTTTPAEGWRTFKLFGAPDRQDRVLHGVVHPAVAAARAAGELDAWFFQRYVDPPGPRHHLRVRVHGQLDRFAARLDAALAPARAVDDVVAVETAAYHPERARLRGHAVEPIFARQSELICALLDRDGDPLDNTVLAMDALAVAARLSLARRRALAAELRAGAGVAADPARDTDWRTRQRRLPALLAAPPPPFAMPARVPAELLATLVHLTCVRFLGPDCDAEHDALYAWDRALESLVARARPR